MLCYVRVNLLITYLHVALGVIELFNAGHNLSLPITVKFASRHEALLRHAKEGRPRV